MTKQDLDKIKEIIYDYTLDMPIITMIDMDKIDETAVKIYALFINKNN